MKTAIVYFSVSGNTRYLAEQLAGKLAGRLVELSEAKPGRGVVGFLKNGFRAATSSTSRLLGDPWSEAEGHDTIYLLTPIWAGHSAPAMNTFIEGSDLTGRNVYLVTLQADPKGHGSDRVHDYLSSKVSAKGGSVECSYALHSAPPGRFAGEDQLERELEKII